MKKKAHETEEEFIPETDDSMINEVEIEDVEERTSNKLKLLRDKLKICETEKLEHLEGLQRTKADFLNSKRRLEEQLVSDKQRISRNYIESLLPLCDSFEMAMNDSASWKSVDKDWRKGIEGIYTQLQNILKSANVEEITTEGVLFNPHEHEAVSHENVEDTEKVDHIISVLQKGYKQNDYIIRPSKVTVGKTE